MKKIILAIAAVAFAVNMSAQQEQSEKTDEQQPLDQTEMVVKRTEATVKQLGLNEEQAAKLLELNKKYATKMRENSQTRRPGMGSRPMSARRPGMRSNRIQGERRVAEVEMQKDSTQVKDFKPGERPREMTRHNSMVRPGMGEYEAELREILTEEQFAAYKEQHQFGGKRFSMQPKREEKKTE